MGLEREKGGVTWGGQLKSTVLELEGHGALDRRSMTSHVDPMEMQSMHPFGI